MINKNLGGFFPVSVVYEGDIKDVVILKKIDQLEKEIGALVVIPAINYASGKNTVYTKGER